MKTDSQSGVAGLAHGLEVWGRRAGRRAGGCRRPIAVAVAAVLAVVVGCGDPEAGQEVPAPTDEARMLVEAHLDEIDEVMVDGARHRAFRDAIDEFVAAERQRPFQDRVEDGLRYSTVFDRVYDRERAGGHFVDEWGLTDRGRELLEVVDDADRHAIAVETFHRDEIRHRLDTIVGDEAVEPVDGGFEPGVREVEALVEHVGESLVDGDEAAGVQRLIEAVGSVDEKSAAVEGLERMREYNQREAEHFAERATAMAQLELYLADAALRYAREMRHGNLERVDGAELAERGSTEIILERMEQTLGELRDVDAAAVRDVARRLEPSHPQYRALVEATDEYRQIVEDGGWNRVRHVEVQEGVASVRVRQLRERLEAEGYRARPEEPDEEFDDRVVDESLIEGIKTYQRTHQFDVDGQPTWGMWRSLNISAADRLEQMELTLQRWRESSLEDDEDYILVNIPGFDAQVWTDGTMAMEFSVVVGNNNRRCNEDDEQWEYPDATPTVTSKMDHIEFNPYWYVPERIVEETLEPELEDDEDYYEDEGYEEVEMGGREVVRQKPGEDNALGAAKFIFPNAENVYLHDTPETHYFDYPVRAFSHGCIRVSRPVELAKTLVDWEGADVDVDEVLESEQTRRYEFDRELPVMLEYYTVWVDDEGEPNFLADIYDRDARRLSDEPEEFFECDPDEIADDEDGEGEGEEDADDEPEDGQEDEPEDLDEDIGP